MKSKKRILYFIEGNAPTDEERADAATIGKVAFRNARFADPEQGVEPFDAVAGCAPAHYLAHAEAQRLKVIEAGATPTVETDTTGADALKAQSTQVSPPKPVAIGGWNPNT